MLKQKNKGPYKIDSIAYSLYDLNSDTVFYNYTFFPNNDEVFESVVSRNDTTFYLSKSTYLNEINRESTVIIKDNRIIKTQYFQPIGIYAQDGLVLHNYYYYNTNDRIDSIVHVSHGTSIYLPPTDTIRETYPITYVNGDLVFDSANTNYSSYANQKNLIGLDVNEFLAAFYSTIHSNLSEDYLYSIRDDIREFPFNCLIHNFNTFNSNSAHLFNKLGGYDIVYTFDTRYNNRIKDIDFYLNSKRQQHYTFYYQQ
jgi:hypothetical protein